MLLAKALAHALTETFSGDALEMAGDRAAIVTTASAILRVIMVVFLEGQKYQRPRIKIRTGQRTDKREKFTSREVFLMCSMRRSGDAAAGQYPLRQFLQVLASPILGSMQ